MRQTAFVSSRWSHHWGGSRDKGDHPLTCLWELYAYSVGKWKEKRGWGTDKLLETACYDIWFAWAWKWLVSIPQPSPLLLGHSHRSNPLGWTTRPCWFWCVSLFLMRSENHRLEKSSFCFLQSSNPILWIQPKSKSHESNLKVFSASQIYMQNNVFSLVWVNRPHHFILAW